MKEKKKRDETNLVFVRLRFFLVSLLLLGVFLWVQILLGVAKDREDAQATMTSTMMTQNAHETEMHELIVTYIVGTSIAGTEQYWLSRTPSPHSTRTQEG